MTQLANDRERPRPAPGHSRFIFFMKAALPVVAVAIGLALIIWPRMADVEDYFSLGYAKLSQAEGDRPQMVNARLAGIDAHQRPYTVTARHLTPSPQTEDIVTLQAPEADVTLSDGSWVSLAAQTGVYQNLSDSLDLQGNVSLYHDSGLEFYTSRAHIDMAEGSVEGHEPVFGRSPAGKINAQGFSFSRHDKTIVFNGKAHLSLHLDRINME